MPEILKKLDMILGRAWGFKKLQDHFVWLEPQGRGGRCSWWTVVVRQVGWAGSVAMVRSLCFS